jgi:hypothetical protein
VGKPPLPPVLRDGTDSTRLDGIYSSGKSTGPTPSPLEFLQQLHRFHLEIR